KDLAVAFTDVGPVEVEVDLTEQPLAIQLVGGHLLEPVVVAELLHNSGGRCRGRRGRRRGHGLWLRLRLSAFLGAATDERERDGSGESDTQCGMSHFQSPPSVVRSGLLLLLRLVALHGLLEIPDPLTQSAADLGDAIRAEDQDHYQQDEEDFAETETAEHDYL